MAVVAAEGAEIVAHNLYITHKGNLLFQELIHYLWANLQIIVVM